MGDVVDHLEYIRIHGLVGGEKEAFQGLMGESVTASEETADTTTVNLDVTPIVEALAPLAALATMTPQPTDLTPIVEALAPLANLSEVLDCLGGIRDRIPEIDLSEVIQRLEDIRDRVGDLAFVDAKIDFGFFKVYLKGRTAEM